jgi:7-cyano-7-deazaguanine reductase
MDHVLGKAAGFAETYTPELLVPMPRAEARAAIGLADALPFRGEDVWNAYELSWLDGRGVPQAATMRFAVTSASPRFVESKSLKLYLNSFAQSAHDDWGEVARMLNKDLGAAFGAALELELFQADAWPDVRTALPGRCLDDLAVRVDRYERAPELLELEPARGQRVEHAFHTHLFRSLCPVTGQPDWASMLIRYSGPTLAPESLLRYLISFRRHAAFHETTVEQIFLDLKERCRCDRLTVAGFFQRRGGLDINPVRTDGGELKLRYRLPRQ